MARALHEPREHPSAEDSTDLIPAPSISRFPHQLLVTATEEVFPSLNFSLSTCKSEPVAVLAQDEGDKEDKRGDPH